MATQGIAAGFEYALFMVKSGNYASGINSALANGSGSGAFLLDDVRSAGLSFTDPTQLEVTGGDRSLGTFMFGNSKSSAFTLEVARVDPDVIALISKSAVDTTTMTGYELFSINPNESSPLLGAWALFQRFQPTGAGSDQTDKYHAIVIPHSQNLVRIAGMTYQAEAPVTFNVTPQFTQYFITGTDFADTDMALTLNKTDQLQIISGYRWNVYTWKSDGTSTQVTLPYKPRAANAVLMFKNGVVTSTSTVTPATGVVTFTASTAGDMHVFIYMVDTWQSTA